MFSFWTSFIKSQLRIIGLVWFFIMCRVRKGLVNDDILEVGTNEANEDEVSTDEELDLDDDLGRVMNYFLFMVFIYICILLFIF